MLVRLRSFYAGHAPAGLLPASAMVCVVTLIASRGPVIPVAAPGRDVIYDGIACALYVGDMWFVLQNAILYFQPRGRPVAVPALNCVLQVEKDFISCGRR